VLRYEDATDREIAALVCSTLAFGSVDLILRACDQALKPLGPRPAEVLLNMGEKEIVQTWAQFQYRFCFPKDMVGLMRGAQGALRDYGSLQALFLAGDNSELPLTKALSAFVAALRRYSASGATIRPNLLPDPAQGSACKRLFLFLRWMVRQDDVDPGGWTDVSPARLVVPMDTHMAATCVHRLGFLDKKRSAAAPNLKDALQATAHFVLYAPEDPVKYDFALTRPGIDPRPGDEIFGCY
jgi:TIGR02757 family protein